MIYKFYVFPNINSSTAGATTDFCSKSPGVATKVNLFVLINKSLNLISYQWTLHDSVFAAVDSQNVTYQSS